MLGMYLDCVQSRTIVLVRGEPRALAMHNVKVGQ